MSLYDDYFTNDDKPFAENFNDALLLSNVFDLTVPIELPRMFNNGEWSTGTGQRKAGVSIIQTEGIDNTNIGITNNSLIANNDATVLITVYPNFNQYGNLQKVYWEFTEGAGENLTVDVLTEQRTVLLTNIPNNSVLSSVPYLQQLNRFILRLNFRSGTGIKKLGFIMQNKQQDRYGAEVGISDVTGLEDDLNNLNNTLNNMNSSKEDKTNKVTSLDNSDTHYPTAKAVKTQVDALSSRLDGLIKVYNFQVTIDNWAGQTGRVVQIREAPYYEGYSAFCVFTKAFAVTLSEFSVNSVYANLIVWNIRGSENSQTIEGKIIYYPSSWNE